MFACLKNLQYLDRSQWKKMDKHLLEELGITKKESSDEIEAMKKKLKEKEELIKNLIRENMEIKTENKNMKAQS